MRNLLLSTVITLLMVPAASFAASDFTTHTHTDTPMELKSISLLNASFKTAAVCFLGVGDCGGARYGSVDSDDGYKLDTIQQCNNEGYAVKSCSLPAYPDSVCPYNNAYYGRCIDDKPRACIDSGYTENVCTDGMIVDKTCPYSSSYMNCKAGSHCDGYHDCGGSWQYCTGTTCSTDSSKCSVTCVSDYFPNSCTSSSACSAAGGVYRNGYCSKSCSSSSGSSSDSSVSECENPGCDPNAYCSLSGYCYCNEGYYGNGTSCEVDRCIGVTCGENAECVHSTGKCRCFMYDYGGDPDVACFVPFSIGSACCYDGAFGMDAESLKLEDCINAGNPTREDLRAECVAAGGEEVYPTGRHGSDYPDYEYCRYQCHYKCTNPNGCF